MIACIISGTLSLQLLIPFKSSYFFSYKTSSSTSSSIPV